MKKDKIDYKLVNITLILLIVLLIYLIRGVWLGALKTVGSIIFPFLLAFALAYVLYPMVKKLQEAGSPKWLAILTVSLITFGIILIVLILAVPMLYEQTLLFISNISVFVSDISSKYELNLKVLQTSLSQISSDMMESVGKYLSSGAINLVNTGVSVVANAIVVIAASLYIVVDMEKIRKFLKENLTGKRKKAYNYLKRLDTEISNYIRGMGMNIIVQGLEYTFAFFIIGHPNFLVLGLLSGVFTIIPIFGGLIVSILALLISSVISTKLFILTAIILVVCPQIDSYVIGPKIYGKSNQLHPLIIIFAVFAGGIIGGFWGIVVSIPVAIILITTLKFFEDDINGKITKIKGKDKVNEKENTIYYLTYLISPKHHIR